MVLTLVRRAGVEAPASSIQLQPWEKRRKDSSSPPKFALVPSPRRLFYIQYRKQVSLRQIKQVPERKIFFSVPNRDTIIGSTAQRRRPRTDSKCLAANKIRPPLAP
jgi:hypothetical protein